VRRKSSAGDADAEAERCQERGERAQLADWFPPPTLWCGSVSGCAHTAMLSAPLSPIKHLIVKGRTCIVDFLRRRAALRGTRPLF
jgi:hypothetical protein